MRKTVFLLALALVLALPAAVAEEIPPEEAGVIRWEALAPEIEAMGLTGSFYTPGVAQVAFWVPDFLYAPEIEETPEENYALALFLNESGDKGFVVTLYPLGCEDIESFAYLADQMNARDGQFLLINGLPAYSFALDDMLHVAFCAEDGYILSFDFFPASDYAFDAVARLIAASIQIV